MVDCYNSTLTTVLNRDTRDVAKNRLVKQDSAVQFPPHDDKYLLANAMESFFIKKVSDIRLHWILMLLHEVLLDPQNMTLIIL